MSRPSPIRILTRNWLNVLLIAAPASWFLQWSHGSGRWLFACAALSLIPAAGIIGTATEHLARRAGPALGGLLNATFGNAAELIIAVVALVSIFLNADYRPGVYGVAIYYVLGMIYFAVSGRNRLVLSPEEEFAMTGGQHGHPETEGYGHTRVGDLGEGQPPEGAAPAPTA